jgi:urease subunit alpha
MSSIGRDRYAALYGPTVGDRIRLADTDLLIEVDRGPMRPGRRGRLRRRQDDPRVDGPGHHPYASGSPDLVITNAVVLDYWGIVKADVGVRDGRIVALGKAGNPDIIGVHPRSSSARAPRSSPARVSSSRPAASTATSTSSVPRSSTEALASGLTTLIGGGTGPAEGTRATTVHTRVVVHGCGCCRRSIAGPSTSLLLGKGNTVSAEALWEQLPGWSIRFQAPRGLGLDPRRDRCLPRSPTPLRRAGGASTPTRSTSPATSRTTLAAIAGRTIHTYHTEGAGGGHAPDIIGRGVAPQRAPVVDQPDPAAHGQHHRRASRHAHGLPPPEPARARGPGVRREPDPGRRRSPPRTSSTTSARSR